MAICWDPLLQQNTQTIWMLPARYAQLICTQNTLSHNCLIEGFWDFLLVPMSKQAPIHFWRPEINNVTLYQLSSHQQSDPRACFLQSTSKVSGLQALVSGLGWCCSICYGLTLQSIDSFAKEEMLPELTQYLLSSVIVFKIAFYHECCNSTMTLTVPL